jgi:uncharacterized protein YgbK (DUF1537 family)
MFHSFVPKIGIVADDLTGACDSGIEFVTREKSVLVLVEPDSEPPPTAGETIFVHNTQSRHLTPDESHTRALCAAKRALSSGADLIFKKVDSALRGNFGVEIGAIMDATGASLAFILTAIPEAGRETIDGVQHIDGVPIAQSFYSRDPEHPVAESSVLIRAEDRSGRKAGLISLQDVRAGNTAAALEKLMVKGRQLIVVDGRSRGDLRVAVECLVSVPEAKIFVGCQGLAQALATVLGAGGETPAALEPRDGPFLLVCGTSHPQSRRQLEVAAAAGQLCVLDIELNRIASRLGMDAPTRELAEACSATLLEGQNVAVRICEETVGFSADLRESVLCFLSGLVARAVERVPLGGLVLTGGETAYRVCRSLGIRALKLHTRIAPLVVASTVVGGRHEGVVVVTKGGSIGPDDIVSRISKFLTGA